PQTVEQSEPPDRLSVHRCVVPKEVLARILRVRERRFRPIEQGVRVLSVVRVERHSGSDRQPYLLLQQVERLVEQGVDAAHERVGLVAPAVELPLHGGVRAAAEIREAARLVEMVLEPLRRELQREIARAPAETVVQDAQSLDVEHEDRERLAVGVADGLGKPLQIQSTLRQRGDRIEVLQEARGILAVQVLKRERDVARYLPQELQLLRTEYLRLRRVQVQHADRRLVEEQRQRSRRPNTDLPQALALGRRRIRLVILGHDG